MTDAPDLTTSPKTPEGATVPAEEAEANRRHALVWCGKTWRAIVAMLPATRRETWAEKRERERRGDE